MIKYGDGVPDSALIMLAAQILKRVRLSLPNETREQALAIIKGVRPAASKNKPIAARAFRRLSSPCTKCGLPIYAGEPCLGCATAKERHIDCKKTEALYRTCVDYVEQLGISPEEK
jgi:hypothetical protein